MYLQKSGVGSLEVQLQQVTKQGERVGSWRLPVLVLAAEAGVKKVEDQQAHNDRQQGE